MAGELTQVRCQRCGVLVLSPIRDITGEALLDRHGPSCPVTDVDGRADGSADGSAAAGSRPAQDALD